MKSRIHDLEEKLKYALVITPEEKDALENGLAQTLWDKGAALKVHEITRDDLNKASEQVAALTSEKEKLAESNTDLASKVSQLEAVLASLCESSS